MMLSPSQGTQMQQSRSRAFGAMALKAPHPVQLRQTRLRHVVVRSSGWDKFKHAVVKVANEAGKAVKNGNIGGPVYDPHPDNPVTDAENHAAHTVANGATRVAHTVVNGAMTLKDKADRAVDKALNPVLNPILESKAGQTILKGVIQGADAVDNSGVGKWIYKTTGARLTDLIPGNLMNPDSPDIRPLSHRPDPRNANVFYTPDSDPDTHILVGRLVDGKYTVAAAPGSEAPDAKISLPGAIDAKFYGTDQLIRIEEVSSTAEVNAVDGTSIALQQLQQRIKDIMKQKLENGLYSMLDKLKKGAKVAAYQATLEALLKELEEELAAEAAMAAGGA